MRLFLVPQLLLVFVSVLALTRAQTTTDTTTTAQPTPTSNDTATTETTTTQAIVTTTTETTTVLPETTTVLPVTTTTENTTENTTVLPETTTTETTIFLTPGTTVEPTTTPLTETTTKTTTVLLATTTATTSVSNTISTTTAWTAPAIFYPFGSAAGDTEQIETGGETYIYVTFSTPFMFFGRKYNNAYVNNNGLLSFNQPLPEAHPYQFPTHGTEDFIAPLWTELDDIGIGKYSYQQYTNGSVLTRASQDINQYFPHKGFSASWVFVATWDYVHSSDLNVLNLHSAPGITFQVVLISGGGFSFILMNYGDCAGTPFPVEAGYDTINSTDYYVIHYDFNGNIPNLKNMSNVYVPGRWAFLVNNSTENVIGVQIKLRSFLDLTQPGNFEVVLQQIKQELVNRGVSSFVEMKLRKVKKTQP